MSFSSLDEALNFVSSLNNHSLIDFVELPPDTRGDVTDSEDLDEENLKDSCIPNEFPGGLEVHIHDVDEKQEYPSLDSEDPVWEECYAPVFKLSPISDEQQSEVSQIVDDMKNLLRNKSCVEIFEYFFDDEIVEHIVNETVRYARQNNDHEFEFSKECLYKFVGILFLSGYHTLPSQKLYWSTEDDLEIPFVRQCMTKNRFLTIKKYLHFNDNSSKEEKTRSFKILPLIELFNKKFKQFGFFSSELSTDEQMCEYFGKSAMKQFIATKPIRFGFKFWALCASKYGFCYDLQLYEGKNNKKYPINGLGASVVLSHVELLKNPSLYQLYFDNFFAGFDLFKHLTTIGMKATATVRANRTKRAPFIENSKLKKKERGYTQSFYDKKSGVNVISWLDNNNVKMFSNHESIEPTKNCSRWSRKYNQKITFSQPHSIQRYNSYMGGVDKNDFLTNSYKITIKSKKWYLPVFNHLLMVAMTNASIVYNICNPKVSLLDFQREVSQSFMRRNSLFSDPKTGGRPLKRKFSFVEFDLKGHFLSKIPEENGERKQKRCKVCSKKIRTQCNECKVALCLSDESTTCFEKFHRR